MKLLYVKILETDLSGRTSFVGVDINFNGLHRFTYNQESQDIQYSRNDEYFQNLYGDDISITSIVGSNGVGKTTLLRFLRYLIARLEGREEHHSYIFDSWKWIAIVEGKSGIEIITAPSVLPPSSASTNFPEKLMGSETFSTSLSYSPHFELEEPSFSHPEYIDVSTDMLFYHSVESKEEDDQTSSAVLNFRRDEVKRQMDFVEFSDRSLSEEGIAFYKEFVHSRLNLSFWQLVKKFDQEPRYIDYNDIKIYREFDTKFLQRHVPLVRQVDSGSKDSLYELAKLWFLKRIIEVLFYNIETRPDPKEMDTHSFRQPLQGKDVSVYKKVAESLPSTMLEFLSNLECMEPRALKAFRTKIDEVLKILEEDVVYAKHGSNAISISLEAAKQLLKLEAELLAQLPHKSDLGLFNFNWPNLSTGEKAYLNLFSRLHFGYTRLKETFSINDANHLYFLIDEPSTGFHPQWQKEYLAKLLKFLSVRVSEKKHLIIATHSPYLVSDVQKEDVIRLHKADQETKELADNTFGANIHELLADSFYLRNGFMGDFARTKINSLIEFLNQSEESTQEWNEKSAKHFIEIIGEPLLRQDLKELYYSKFSSDDLIAKEIERLQEIRTRNKEQ